MALVVEDGTGVEGADSLVSVEFIDDYAARYGKEGWDALTEDDKEIHARRASLFINSKFPFSGSPSYPYQTFFFPALDFKVRGHLVEGVPVQVKNATAELAIMSVSEDILDTTVARQYTYRRINVAGVEKEERWSGDDLSPASKVLGVIELILEPLLSSSFGNGIATVRLRPGL